jgi:hypothetical protein
MLAVIAVIGCRSIPHGPTESQKYFHTGLPRVYSAGKAALRDLGWQIMADRLPGDEAKIEAQQGAELRTTILIERVTPVRTRVAILVTGASASKGRSLASGVHQGIATILRIEAED